MTMLVWIKMFADTGGEVSVGFPKHNRNSLRTKPYQKVENASQQG